MTSKIISFKDNTGLRQVVTELLEMDDRGLVSDLVVVYKRRFLDSEKEDYGGADSAICRYWFGESSAVGCLGLIAYMQGIINDFIRGFIEE